MKNTAVLPPVQPVIYSNQTPATGAVAVGNDGFPSPGESFHEDEHIQGKAGKPSVKPSRFPFFVRNHDLTLRESCIY